MRLIDSASSRARRSASRLCCASSGDSARQHLQVVAEPFAIAQQREVVGFLRGREREALLASAARRRCGTTRAGRPRRAWRRRASGCIARPRCRSRRPCRRGCARSRPASKIGSVTAGVTPDHAARRGEEAAAADGSATDERQQVHVRIELRLRRRRCACCAASTRQRCATRSGRRPSSSAGSVDGSATALQCRGGRPLRSQGRGRALRRAARRSGCAPARCAPCSCAICSRVAGSAASACFSSSLRIDARGVAIARQRVDLLALGAASRSRTSSCRYARCSCTYACAMLVDSARRAA